MRGYPNNDRWDCGGECIHGGLVGPGRECDDCWEGVIVTAKPALREARDNLDRVIAGMEDV